jgi:hypothetical protein
VLSTTKALVELILFSEELIAEERKSWLSFALRVLNSKAAEDANSVFNGAAASSGLGV